MQAQTESSSSTHTNTARAILLSLCSVSLLAACAAAPRRHYVRTVQPLPASQPKTEVYAYPAQGQSSTQEKRERYKCHNWAVQQSDFDPSAPSAQVQTEQVRVRMAEPNHDIAALGITGAVIGAAVSRPGQGLAGAVIGGTLGALAGAASDNARAEHADDIERRENEVLARHGDRHDKHASSYRRALGACLEGHGYRVQ